MNIHEQRKANIEGIKKELKPKEDKFYLDECINYIIKEEYKYIQWDYKEGKPYHLIGVNSKNFPIVNNLVNGENNKYNIEYVCKSLQERVCGIEGIDCLVKITLEKEWNCISCEYEPDYYIWICFDKEYKIYGGLNEK